MAETPETFDNQKYLILDLETAIINFDGVASIQEYEQPDGTMHVGMMLKNGKASGHILTLPKGKRLKDFQVKVVS